MLQRLGLLVTVLHDPLLIILDEPASGLDPRGRRDIKHLLLEFKNARKTILFTSHIISDIESIADRVMILQDQKIIESGDISQILNHNSNGRTFISGIDRNGEVLQKETATELVQVEVEKMMKEKIKIISVVPIQKSLEEILLSTKGN
jgi:ABC-2 type transport system ATP-binding protein